MRFQLQRHLGPLLRGRGILPAGLAPQTQAAPVESVPPEFNHRDYVIYLLHMDAAIEHALMVQYLYAAYTLGGPQVPEAYHQTVAGWREVILGVAKEEMAHLISVQNVLRLIGGPLHLAREDFPWISPFFPFPFKLEPLTLDSLAKYVYAESPEDWSGPWAEDVKRRVDQQAPNPHRVSELFAELIGLMENPEFLPDATFQPNTYPFQASWDEWGRGYKAGARGNHFRAGPEQTPDLLVVPLASRDDAVSALKKIAQQGEAYGTLGTDGLPSHFERFLEIYKHLTKLLSVGHWEPARPVAINPYVPINGGFEEGTPILYPEAQDWASLSNIRYRMLLNFLLHSFELDDGLKRAGTWTPRGLIINSAFGEMYNLRAISEFLMQTPLALASEPGADKVAGPPFLMPYTLNLPQAEADRWRLHRDTLRASARLIERLLPISPPERHGYLRALRENDQALLQSIDRILAGQSTPHALL